MTATTLAQSRAFAVWWKDLERWVIPSSVLLGQSLPKGWERVRVGSLVRQVTKRIKADPDHEYKMAGVKWYGEGVFHRETVRGDGMSATYVTPLVTGALIYNRLFAWKASFAVVTPEFADCYVSNEFPQFVPDPSRILPEYLYLFCTRAATIRAVNAASTGSSAVSRNRFKEEEFLNFEISLPPLTEQEAIVARWRKVQRDIAAARERAEKKQTEIESRFFSDLGLQLPDRASMPKAFAVPWRDFHRWGVSFNYLNQSGADLSLSRYPVVALESIVDMVQYGTSEKANSNRDGVAVIRMNNILDGELDLRNLKHLRLSERDRKRLLLRNGDILFNRTNSKELVGKCAVYHSPEEYVFASYLIRVRIDDSKADPDFVAYAINSPIGRQQIDALSRQIIGQANINSEELRGLQVPLPPLAVQKEIVERIAEQRRKIARERETVERLSGDVDTEIEALILGSKRLN